MLRPVPDPLAEKRVRRAAMELWRGQRWLALSRGRMLTARFMANGIDLLAANQAIVDGQTFGWQELAKSPEIDGLGRPGNLRYFHVM